MILTGLHILLTYRCTRSCAHCFVWGSPKLTGVFSPEQLSAVLEQAAAIPSIKTIFFEGGEPFLYYFRLVKAIEEATAMGFSTGVVTNGFWANSHLDAEAWLAPLVDAGLDVLQISVDALHGVRGNVPENHPAYVAAVELGLDASVLVTDVEDIMYRGRASAKLAGRSAVNSWMTYTECPHENLADPGRVHLDPLGNIHVCQGIVIGNIFETPLQKIVASYKPKSYPIVSDLIEGGPAQLHYRYSKNQSPSGYADACHLCYTTRVALREQFSAVLIPDQVYGILG